MQSGFAAEAGAAGIAASGRKAGCGMLFIAANQEADTPAPISLISAQEAQTR